MEYIKDKDYAYKTETEKELDELVEKAKKEGYFEAIEPTYKSMLESLNHDKQADVVKNRKEITLLLEEEIVRHYYLQSGRFEIAFVHDREIEDAINLLKDPNEFNRLLKK